MRRATPILGYPPPVAQDRRDSDFPSVAMHHVALLLSLHLSTPGLTLLAPAIGRGHRCQRLEG